MTSIPVNNAKSVVMDFANKAPGKISGTGETGSFTDVLNKQTGDGPSKTKTASVSNEPSSKTQTKVSNSKHNEALHDKVSKTKDSKNDNSDEVTDAVRKAGEEIVEEIADELDITEEEVLQIMEILGLTFADLMQPESMMMIVMQASGETDTMALLTDAELGESLKNLNQFVQNLKSEMQAAFSVSKEQLEDLLKQMSETASVISETNEEDALVLNNQPKIVVEDFTEDTADSVLEDESNTPADNVKTADETSLTRNILENQTELKKEAASDDGRQETEHGTNGQDGTLDRSMFAQNLNQGTTVLNTAATENVPFAARQTTEIMNQIMDYMRIQIKPEMTQLEMQLHPESLGNVNVHIASKEGVVTAQFTTQNETVKAAIESQIVQLKETFAQQGVKIEAIEVNVEANGFRQEYEESREQENTDGDDKKRNVARRINLSNPDMFGEENLSEEEQLAVSMMEANGNTVDYTA